MKMNDFWPKLATFVDGTQDNRIRRFSGGGGGGNRGRGENDLLKLRQFRGQIDEAPTDSRAENEEETRASL